MLRGRVHVKVRKQSLTVGPMVGALSRLYSWGLPLPSQKWGVGQRETGQTPEGLGMGSDCPMDPDSAPPEGSRPGKVLPMAVT